jgi:hypothetical protein
MLSDSILSFNTIHDRLKRCETAGLHDGTWVGDELATQTGLDIQSPGFARDLRHAAQQSYSLARVMRVASLVRMRANAISFSAWKTKEGCTT